MTRSNLRFTDLLLLVVVQQNPGVTYAQLPVQANRLRESWGIAVNYAAPFAVTMSEFTKTMRTLVALGLVERGINRRGFYATEAAKALFARLGEDWRAWPLVTPIRNRQLMLGEGILASEFRGQL